MNNFLNQDNDFLNLLTQKLEKNLSKEAFGVSELAEEMNMSRSNLLRKVKKATNLSVSQLINQARLQRGLELLRTTPLNVSEVSHQVGFNSTSYFIKCFREHFGYPPGEVGKRTIREEIESASLKTTFPKPQIRYISTGLVVLLVLMAGWVYWQMKVNKSIAPEKSIVVLPFKNDSADSSNVYLINGLMDATLNNLQKIKNLKVLSRTTAEKYRSSSRSIPEIAKELNVHYLVEGSGQKIGNGIVLNVQLIDGSQDGHLWSKQYRREVSDIFLLQQEISKDIAAEIQVIVTPEEMNRLEKIPTQNPEAYDLFLKGVQFLQAGNDENHLKAVKHFQEAIQLDPSFSLAYACIAIAYYYLDVFKAEKQYLDELGNNADKALLHDPKSGESLTAKAMYYLLRKEYTEALPYLEKGLEYHPNSTLIISLLADYYGTYVPNTGKYLEYALKGLQLDVESGDSVSISNFYLRLGNALIQSGFIEESMRYLDKSLDFNPNNHFSGWVSAFVQYPNTKDLEQTRALLKVEFEKDTNRFDILLDLGKVSYYLREYDTAFQYYERFNRFRNEHQLDYYTHENMIIGVVYEKVGQDQKGKEFIESYRGFLETDKSAYRELGLAMYYFHMDEIDRGMSHFRNFSKEDNIQFWIILFLADDPVVERIHLLPEFQEIHTEITSKFWRNHQKIKEKLEEEGL